MEDYCGAVDYMVRVSVYYTMLGNFCVASMEFWELGKALFLNMWIWRNSGCQ